MTGQEPSPGRKGYFARQAEIEAEKNGLTNGLTVEEYGVYKEPNYVGIKPFTSAGGILFLAILITLNSVTMFVYGFLSLAGLVYVSEPPTVAELILPAVILVLLPIAAWWQYLKERKAVRLRKASGKTLQPPTRRSRID
jgi:hypothetical protein